MSHIDLKINSMKVGYTCVHQIPSQFASLLSENRQCESEKQDSDVSS